MTWRQDLTQEWNRSLTYINILTVDWRHSVLTFSPQTSFVLSLLAATVCEVWCVLWKCYVSLESRPETSDHECSLCLVRRLQAACVCPQTWQHTPCFSLSVHLQRRRQWTEACCSESQAYALIAVCFSHFSIELLVAVCEDEELIGTTHLCVRVYVYVYGKAPSTHVASAYLLPSVVELQQLVD